MHTTPHRSRQPRPGACLTDPASRLVLGKHGGYLQAYNIQIACARNQLLLAIELHDNPADMTALVPLVNRTRHNCSAAAITDQVAAWLADSGYASTSNFAALAELPLFMSITKEYHQTHGVMPPGHHIPPGQRQMAARLAPRQPAALPPPRRPGRARVRPAVQRFGRRLHHRGTHADTEIKLLVTVHNLNKLFRHGTRNSP